jgi:hypothetical protein
MMAATPEIDRGIRDRAEAVLHALTSLNKYFRELPEGTFIEEYRESVKRHIDEAFELIADVWESVVTEEEARATFEKGSLGGWVMRNQHDGTKMKGGTFRLLERGEEIPEK